MTTISGVIAQFDRRTGRGTLRTTINTVPFTLPDPSAGASLTKGCFVTLSGTMHRGIFTNALPSSPGGSKVEIEAALREGFPLPDSSGRPSPIVPVAVGIRLADAFHGSALTAGDLLERPASTLVRLIRLITPRLDRTERLQVHQAIRRLRTHLKNAPLQEFLAVYRTAAAAAGKTAQSGNPYRLYWSLWDAYDHRKPTALLQLDPWVIYRVPYIPDPPASDFAIGDAIAQLLGFDLADGTVRRVRGRAAILAAAFSLPSRGDDGGPAMSVSGQPALLLARAAKLAGLDPKRAKDIAWMRDRLDEAADKQYRTIKHARDVLQRIGGHYQIAPIAFNEAHAAQAIADRLLHPQSARGIVTVHGNAFALPDGTTIPLAQLSLSIEQATAVCNALASRVFIITGGPGRGKTVTLAACGRIAQAMGLRVAACAPTGKAARVLTNKLKTAGVTGVEATTIHHLTHFRPSTPPLTSAGGAEAVKDTRGIDADVVLVDEASMLDIVTFGVLCLHLQDRTSLILSGDPQQLPAVGPGRILHDLLVDLPQTLGRFGVARPYPVPTARLQHNFRQTGKGLEIAKLADQVWSSANPPQWSRAHMPPAIQITDATGMNPTAFDRAVLRAAKRTAHNGRPFIVLAPRRMPQERLNELLRGVALGPAASASYAAGDRLIQIVNHEHLANGDIGTVRQVIRGAGGEIAAVVVEFESGTWARCAVADDAKAPAAMAHAFGSPHASLSLSVRQPIENTLYAYALTVHKGQGSEYDTVILAIPPDMPLSACALCNHNPGARSGRSARRARTTMAGPRTVVDGFWNRHLLYTGITRAQRELIVIAPISALEHASHALPRGRISKLAYRIARRIQQGATGTSAVTPLPPRPFLPAGAAAARPVVKVVRKPPAAAKRHTARRRGRTATAATRRPNSRQRGWR